MNRIVVMLGVTNIKASNPHEYKQLILRPKEGGGEQKKSIKPNQYSYALCDICPYDTCNMLNRYRFLKTKMPSLVPHCTHYYLVNQVSRNFYNTLSFTFQLITAGF